MKKATKAALQSALILPGAGHFGLEHYLRGSVLMLSALLAIFVIVKQIYRQAASMVFAVRDGEVPDPALISESLMYSVYGPNDMSGRIALLVLVVAWLIGIIDAYRLGAAADANAHSDSTRP